MILYIISQWNVIVVHVTKAIQYIYITLKLWLKHPLLYGQELDFRGHKAGDSTENGKVGMNRTIFLKHSIFMDFMCTTGGNKGLRTETIFHHTITHDSYAPLEQYNYQP